MSRKKCVQLMMGCLFAAAVSTAANDSTAGEVAAMLFSGHHGVEFTTCSGDEIHAETVMYWWWWPVCEVKAYTSMTETEDCAQTGNRTRVRLRTDDGSILCTAWGSADGSIVSCAYDGPSRLDGGPCLNRTLQAFGTGEN